MRIGYARVSGQDQCTDLQLDALKAASCEKIFTEKASGAQRDRPELKAVLEYMRDDGSDVLVVWKLDRLARSLRQLIETVEDLEKRGIGFESLTERIDTTSAAGRLTFHIFACMAEFERSIGRERTRAALEASRARGRARTQLRGRHFARDQVGLARQGGVDIALAGGVQRRSRRARQGQKPGHHPPASGVRKPYSHRRWTVMRSVK